MTATIVKDINFNQCQSLYLYKLKDKNNLPHYKQFVDSTSDGQTDALIINHQYYSLEELRKKIIERSHGVSDYFYLAVNKFCIYSTVDSEPTANNSEWDSLLVQYCHSAINDKFDLVGSVVRPDDVGQLGNFVHPVTTMIFKRYG